ncbi:Aldehyde/histidinol dehydrogenase [Mucidula mucida]|nr:Aldehyde/histidinol dehydrogenase [Mucidula mucida]
MSPLWYTHLLNRSPLFGVISMPHFGRRCLSSIDYRKYLLTQIAYMLRDNTVAIEDALFTDLGKPKFEVHMFAGNRPSHSGDRHYPKNLSKWTAPEKPAFSLVWSATRRVVYKQGKGVCLIVGPFNYPMAVCVRPIVSAIAAGNTVVFKPSESTPAMSALFAEMFPKYVNPGVLRVVNGGIEVMEKLLDMRWAHLVFTGSTRVGRIVSIAAAKTLTPVTMELGGKSPVFIHPSCDMQIAARRILWGKVVNAGQTCIAPDYVLVPKELEAELVDALKKAHDEFYPDGPFAAGVMGKMVTAEAFKRVTGLLKATQGTIAFGGDVDEATKAIAPTVVVDVPFNDALMSEEIFGPVLPIVTVASIDEGIDFVNNGEHPLAIYVFGKDEQFKKQVLSQTQSGAISMNDVVLHAASHELPLSGVGASGIRGQYGFDTFTHFRASMDPPNWLDVVLGIRYPPYTERNIKLSSYFCPSIPSRPKGPSFEMEM